MNKIELALMKNYVGKMYRVFLVIISAISLVELVLMIRGLFFFNLERLKLRMYLYSYIFLFLSSVSALLTLVVFKKWETHWKKILWATYIYSACLFIWSAFVTCIDCYADGDSGIIVYVMTCISVGALTLIKPVFFIPAISISSISMLAAVYFARGSELYSSGFYINFAIFMALAIFINFHTYNLSLRDFENGQKLKKLSYTDQLTNVYNRRRLDKHISAHTDAHKSFVFVLMDIDNFKEVNDLHGHAVGDRCLALLAEKLTEKFGEHHVYRFGGDEFAVIPKMNAEDTYLALEEINRTLPSYIEGIDLHISAGIYTTREDDSAGSVFINTDRALYESKRAGKAKCTIYKPEKL